jgi:hypothetical protein
MGLSKQGWGYMLQWFNDGTMVKAGFTTAGLPGVLAAFARHNGHRLVVVKAWEATKEDYELIADRLKPFVGSNGWMNDGLLRFSGNRCHGHAALACARGCKALFQPGNSRNQREASAGAQVPLESFWK